MSERAVAPDRAPDRVTFSAWEPVYGQPVREVVASEWTLFKVMRYTEVKRRHLIGWERWRFESWVEPAALVPVFDGVDTFTAEHRPGRTIGRKVREFDPAR